MSRPVPRLLRPLGVRPVAWLWGGLSLSAVGDQLFAVALGWIAVDVLGPRAGYLGALQATTVLAVALLAGQGVDRLAPLRAMLAADLGRAGVLLGLMAWWMATGSPSAAGLALAVVSLAVGQAVFQPALQAVLPRLVGDRALLPAANALFDGTDRSARLLGPGLLALLAGVLPAVHFLTLDALSFLASAGAILLIRARVAEDQAPRASGVREGAFGGIRRGIRALRGHRLLGYVLASAAPLNGSWFAVFFLLLPLLLQALPGMGIAEYGLLIAAYGAANLASNIVCGSLEMPARPAGRMFGSSMLVGAGMAGFALLGAVPEAWRLPAMLAVAAISGTAGPLKDIPVAVLRQTALTPGDIPAATRAMLAANSTGVLVAMLAMPGLAAVLPVEALVLGCGAVAFGVGAEGWVRLGRG